ncbi:spondin domain-containing protein [Pseudoduganella albidiflava]|nr:spondin domain-containing protein [Pseudoduganella albidiflava]GGY68903.1 hypothetical protein GCM10007387_58710 [Pseudoduganella albidiflava]
MNKFFAFGERVAPASSTTAQSTPAARQPALRAGVTLACALAASGAAVPVHADEADMKSPAGIRPLSVTVSVTNLTHATWFAPILVAAHPATYTAFTEGKPATPELQALAEIGDIAPLAERLPAGSVAVLNPANGPLKPGDTATTKLPPRKGTLDTRLSILAMLVPTNDAFTALNAIEIPTKPGKYVYTLNGYDAGTEANNEAQASAPGVGQPGLGLPPFLDDAPDLHRGAPGFANTRAEGYVHVHRGIVGSAADGDSVLDHTTYRWMNPVARVTLIVR